MSDLQLIRTREAAALLGMSTKTLRRHVTAGRIGCVVIGLGKINKWIAFTPKDLELFVKQQREAPEVLHSPHSRLRDL